MRTAILAGAAMAALIAATSAGATVTVHPQADAQALELAKQAIALRRPAE